MDDDNNPVMVRARTTSVAEFVDKYYGSNPSPVVMDPPYHFDRLGFGEQIVSRAGRRQGRSYLELYSPPLIVTNSRMTMRILLPPDSGSDLPALRVTRDAVGMTQERILRLIHLLQSPDRRKRKRGLRLFREEFKR